MNNGKLINLLEQFPRDQLVELGFVSKEDPGTIVCLAIGDVVLSDKHLILLDLESIEIIRETIKVNLHVKGAGTPKESAVTEGTNETPTPTPQAGESDAGPDQAPGDSGEPNAELDQAPGTSVEKEASHNLQVEPAQNEPIIRSAPTGGSEPII
jgi:hypothetical protein